MYLHSNVQRMEIQPEQMCATGQLCWEEGWMGLKCGFVRLWLQAIGQPASKDPQVPQLRCCNPPPPLSVPHTRSTARKPSGGLRSEAKA